MVSITGNGESHWQTSMKCSQAGRPLMTRLYYSRDVVQTAQDWENEFALFGHENIPNAVKQKYKHDYI